MLTRTPLAALTVLAIGAVVSACGVATTPGAAAETAPREQAQLVDRGTGIVHLARFPGIETGGHRADTIPVHAEPRGDSAVIARFILRTDSMTWGFDLESAPPVESNLLEYGYEELGLPADSAPRADGWVRVVHGFGADSTPRTGWVRLVADDVAYQAWSDILPENVLFFLSDADIRFRDAPDGRTVALPLHAEGSGADRRLDYILHPLEARGDWLRVRAVTPSDYCFDPPSPRDTTVWIRYLDERGRPRVWYHTRGC